MGFSSDYIIKLGLSQLSRLNDSKPKRETS